MSDDSAWANESLRKALQNIQDAATKPLHAEIERLSREQSQVSDLLAVIHCDGGHYREDFGRSAAIDAAMEVVVRERRELAEAREILRLVADDKLTLSVMGRINRLLASDQPPACAVPGSNVGHILGSDGACEKCGHWFHPARTDKSSATAP